MPSAASAVVFAYHDVGVRCLKTLLSGGVHVPLVVTVADDPDETQWFASVATTAAEYGIEVMTPTDAKNPELLQLLTDLAPDFIFSFYYRALLPVALLNTARKGALNVHGSLLPQYRGRAPINWAILRGESETGATLHYMAERADAGDIVDQLAVPILIDDQARDVFNKVTVAAETILARSMPALMTATAARRAQALAPGQYFGRRRPEDGRIDWSQGAKRVHDLVRAVAPPFPGAFADIAGERWWLHRTRLESRRCEPASHSRLTGSGGQCFVEFADGAVLRVLAAKTVRGPVELAAAAIELQKEPRQLD